MCDRSSVLILFLIIKIILLIILPIILLILYRRESKVFNIVGALNIVFLVLLIILRLIGNDCVSNSNFSYLKAKNNGTIDENPSTYYDTVLSTDKYLTKENKNAYYYDINSEPLKNVLITCNKKSYMEQYGSGISAIATLISTKYNFDLNIIYIITYLDNNKLIDCNNGFDFNAGFVKLGEEYSYRVLQISGTQVDNYISNGYSVLVETINKPDEDNNFGCTKDYIVIYNKNNDGLFNIINPNDHYDSYFCPSNTIGYGSIIEGKQNDKAYSLDNINSKALRYFVIEVE